VNPSSGGRVVPYGQTDTDRETDRHDAGRVETESDGTQRRTGGEVKGKEASGVGSQQSSVCFGT